MRFGIVVQYPTRAYMYAHSSIEWLLRVRTRRKGLDHIWITFDLEAMNSIGTKTLISTIRYYVPNAKH